MLALTTTFVLLTLPAEPPPEVQVGLLLSAHHAPPTRAQLEAAVPAAKEVLLSMARREELFLHHRNRALEALAQWPGDDEVQALYLGVLASEAPIATKQRVLLRIPLVFQRSEEILRPFLGHTSPILRRAADVALRSPSRWARQKRP